MMIQGYLVTVGFDWQVTADPDTGLRPLELYLIEQTTAGNRIGTFGQLQANKPFAISIFDLTAQASLELESHQQLDNVTLYSPVAGTVRFRKYDTGSKQPDASPLSETEIEFGSAGDEAYVAYTGINTSISFPSGAHHTWRLENSPALLDHTGRFGISIRLAVEARQGADDVAMSVAQRRSFFVDPEIIVEGDG